MKTMDRLIASALLAGLCFCIPVSVSGQVWTGALNQNWFSGLNWIPFAPPASSSTAFILTAPPANISNSGATASILNLGTGGTLNVNSGGGLAVGNATNIGLGGTLNLLGTGTLTSHSIVLALGTMNFKQTSPAAVFDVPISGVGTVDVLGGTTILGVNNSYLGETIITGGASLAVGAPFATGFSSVSVLNGTLKTTSLVNTHVPVTINVGGNYTQGSSGTLELGVAGLGLSQYDRVQAVGTARLGGALNLFGLGDAPFAPSNGNAFAVVIAGHGRFSRFADINDEEFNTNGLQRVDIYTRNALVVLYLKPHVPPEPEPEPSPQPPDVKPPVPPPEEPPPIDQEEDNVVLPPVDPSQPLPEPEVVQLLDPTAEELTSLYQIGFAAAEMQRFNLGDRMFQIQQSVVPVPTGTEISEGKGVEGKAPPPVPQPSPTNRWGVWSSSSGDFVNLDGTSAAQGYRFTNFGISAGVDYLVIPDHFAVGLFGGYSHTWVSFSPSGSATANTGRGGLYATYFNQGWWVNVAAWGGGSDYSTSRQALAGTANGSTGGWEVSTYGEAGKDFQCGNLSFGPTLAMQYTNVHVNGFGENGSLVPLNIHGDSQDSLTTDVGGRAYYKWHLGNIPVIPNVRLAWEHEYFVSTLPITVSAPLLDNATATFNGPFVGHDSLIINANISVQWTPQIWMTIGYDGQLARENYSSNAVSGTFSFSF
jgi:fibronectin-binding autotransporter adhesin